MLRRRIRSALYIDFENVPLPPDAIANWLAWLEDGAFEPGSRPRRFLQKRVYWNSHAERNRDLFQRYGFLPILVGKFAGLKNGADIRMAMDVVETTYTRAEIDEFILLTGDSDFVPVLERLRDKAKTSAIVVTEHRPNIHTTYQLNADVLIPSRRLAEAAQYRRPRQGLLGRLLRRSPQYQSPPKAKTSAPATGPSKATRVPQSGASAATTTQIPSEPTPVIEIAARRVAKLLVQQPRNYVAQKRVLAELERVQGFRRQGPTAYFGAGSYRAMMKELARLDNRISVVEQPGGGTGVVFIPPVPNPDAAKPPAAPAATAKPREVAAVAGKPAPGPDDGPAATPPEAPPASSTEVAPSNTFARAPEEEPAFTATPGADAVRRALAAADSMPAPAPYVPIALPANAPAPARAQPAPAPTPQPATADH